MGKRKLPSRDEMIEVTTGALDRQDMALAMEMSPLQAEREADLQRSAEQVEREQLIAQSHEVAGRIQSNLLMKKFVTVSNLVHLKQIKETKIYRDLPNIGTWEKYCDYLGLSRQIVDQDLANLSVFGEDFLITSNQFGLGYREMRKLRQLTHDGTVLLEGDTITIGDKTIPIREDHADDIQDAIEWILTENTEITKRVEKLEKDFNGAVKEETRCLHSEKKALLERVKTLEQFEPKEADREWSVKQMEKIAEAAGTLQLAIAGFIIDPRLKDDRHLQAQVSAHLHEAELALQDARTRLDDVIDMFND